jgi:outer membrane lipoprotein-sorting protein
MRASCAGLLAIGLMVLQFGFVRADESAKELLDKAKNAHGSADGAAKLQNVFLKGKTTITEGGNTITLAFDLSLQGLDKTRMEAEVNATGTSQKMTLVLNADKAWMFNPMLNQTMDAPKEVAVIFRQFMMTVRAASSPASISGNDLQLAHGGESKINDTDAVILRISQKDQPDITLYYDKKTSLPLKAETRIKEPNGGEEANYEFHFSDFKDLDGVKHFGKFKLVRDNKELAEVELNEFKLDQKFEDVTFAKP